MELMVMVLMLLGVAMLGARRLESEFDRESKLQPEPVKISRKAN